MAFCGDSICMMNQDAHSCRPIEAVYASTCINHVLVISIDALLSVVLLFNLFSGSRPKFRLSSPLKIASFALNGFLGLAYLGLGLWILEEKFRMGMDFAPVHWWLVLLTQGVAWVLVCLVASTRDNLRVLSLICLLYTSPSPRDRQKSRMPSSA